MVGTDTAGGEDHRVGVMVKTARDRAGRAFAARGVGILQDIAGNSGHRPAGQFQRGYPMPEL